MNPMKRVGLVAVVLILGALSAASPALAGKPGLSLTRKLVPPVGAPEPGASGQYTFYLLDESMTVSCKNLTPETQYELWHLEIAYTPIGVFYWWGCSTLTADERGRLNVQCLGVNGVDDLWIGRLDEEGYCVVVLETKR